MEKKFEPNQPMTALNFTKKLRLAYQQFAAVGIKLSPIVMIP